MLKNLLLVTLIFTAINSHAQDGFISFFAGPSLSRLNNIKLNRKPYNTDFSNDFGYQLGFGIGMRPDSASPLCMINYRLNHFGGGFNYIEDVPNGSKSYSGRFTKTTLSVSAGVKAFTIKKIFEAFLETELGIRLHTKIYGSETEWSSNQIFYNHVLDKRDSRKLFTWGNAFSMQYKFFKKEDKELLVQYRVYFGWTNELKNLGTGMKLSSGTISVVYRMLK